MMSAFVLGLVAGASQPSAPAQVATPPAPARAERKICRATETLGTILPRRVCRPASEWGQIDQAQAKITERDTQHMRNTSRAGNQVGE